VNIRSQCGRLDVLINNIPGGSPDTFENCDIEDMTNAGSRLLVRHIPGQNGDARIRMFGEDLFFYRFDIGKGVQTVVKTNRVYYGSQSGDRQSDRSETGGQWLS
jgi:hypothetical protein